MYTRFAIGDSNDDSDDSDIGIIGGIIGGIVAVIVVNIIVIIVCIVICCKRKGNVKQNDQFLLLYSHCVYTYIDSNDYKRETFQRYVCI